MLLIARCVTRFVTWHAGTCSQKVNGTRRSSQMLLSTCAYSRTGSAQACSPKHASQNGTQRSRSRGQANTPLLIADTDCDAYVVGMARDPLTRLTRLLLAVWFAAGNLFPASLHPCHAHQVVLTAPAHAHPAAAHRVRHSSPASHAPDQHHCDCAQDCCGVTVANVSAALAIATSAPSALVAADEVAPQSIAATTSAASHRQPPAIGPPSFLI